MINAAIPSNSIFLPDLVELSLAIAGCCRVPDILVGDVDTTPDGQQCTEDCCAPVSQDGANPQVCFAPEGEELTEELREIYEANKKKWGNYQGICGTALLDMAQNFPDLYQQFLDTEKMIEEQLNGANNGDQGQDENDFDEDMKEIYKENKRIWGNFQGICGTALLEMARLYPALYEEFLQNEKRIEELCK